MKTYEKTHEVLGRVLYAEEGDITVGVALEFGLRISYLSFGGSGNLFFEQPRDMTDLSTPEGWRVRGGHRLWLAPENPKIYCPDNDPIEYSVEDDAIVITQKEDPWLHIIKSFRLTFEGSRLSITHKIVNLAEEKLCCSLWAISVMAPGGTEYINFERRDGGMDHWHRISMWDYTSLGDPRATYTRDDIQIKHLPLDTKYKIGVGHPYGPVRYENGNIVFIKHFDVHHDKLYPDANVSYETFFSKYMVEMESLSPLGEISKGESMEHTEILELLHKN